ncbi:hypothetical protein BC827DRAFT_1154270 [Russula dissimulans]|nr:hypothetical protein BC827DRAFT_1154270 [Russula dissimulans]
MRHRHTTIWVVCHVEVRVNDSGGETRACEAPGREGWPEGVREGMPILTIPTLETDMKDWRRGDDGKKIQKRVNDQCAAHVKMANESVFSRESESCRECVSTNPLMYTWVIWTWVTLQPSSATFADNINHKKYAWQISLSRRIQLDAHYRLPDADSVLKNIGVDWLQRPGLAPPQAPPLETLYHRPADPVPQSDRTPTSWKHVKSRQKKVIRRSQSLHLLIAATIP